VGYEPPLSDWGRPSDLHGREWTVQDAEDSSGVIRMLREEFPRMVVEACAGGGGRVDPPCWRRASGLVVPLAVASDADVIVLESVD
jgi:hypothetical protein